MEMGENRRNMLLLLLLLLLSLLLLFCNLPHIIFLELEYIFCFKKVVLKCLRQDANWPIF